MSERVINCTCYVSFDSSFLKYSPPFRNCYLWIHAASVLKERSPEGTLIDAEALRNAREIPDRLDSKLGHAELAKVVETNFAVGH